MILRQDDYLHHKLGRIDEIKKERKNIRTAEEEYWYNRRLYDEYYVFSADSAMVYVNENLRLARETGDTDRENEWKINRSFLLAVTGLLKDAEEELYSITPQDLPKTLLGNYYGQLAYLYSHIDQLSGQRYGGIDYGRMSVVYEDSTTTHIPSTDPQYLWHKAQASIHDPDMRTEVIESLKEVVDNAPLDSRQDAMNAYVLARMYEANGDQENQIRYLVKSGMTDVAIANRDIASLEELAILLMNRGDIDRAYNYINYCQQQALTYPNHVRAATLTKTEAQVHRLYVDRLRESGHHLVMLLIVLGIAVVGLIIIIIYAVRRRRNLITSRSELQAANEQLNLNLRELSEAREAGVKTLTQLKEANERNKEMNEALKEASYVKEECIGAAFALTASYIDKLNDYRRSVSNLVRANSWNELRKLISDPSQINESLKELYSSFDSLFLNIYPDFVSDFNTLLKPGEEINVKPGELNTELRIYALVRLGITDSVKIANVLHCSPQTVYNYRLKIRRKARESEEKFVEQVKKLGKYQD